MTIQRDIENALVTHVEGEIVGSGNAARGPVSQPQREGKAARYAAVRVVGYETSRLPFGQLEITETYLVTVWWRGIARDTRMTEAQALTDALLADQFLTAVLEKVRDSWVSSTAWSEASDAHFVTWALEFSVLRLE